MYKRIFLIVLDSLGIGGADDADKFNDSGSNTLLNIINKTGINLINLNRMGLNNLLYDTNNITDSYYTRGLEISNGKDTLTGHLEMMGVITTVPFKTFTKTGFPKELISELEKRINRPVLGNKNASGTEIIEEFGEIHEKTGGIILYTSADSVLQIAAHEHIIPLTELYHICEIARELTLCEEYKIGRVIARPFIGEKGNYVRTGARRDYALNPSSKTTLDYLKETNYEVISIGKISDVFNNCGITKSIHTIDNLDGINRIITTINEDFTGLCFANLNDFDSKYGHRRDPIGYGKALLEFDSYLGKIKNNLKDNDLLIITADHGNDPTFHGTDHTRENIPVLIYNRKFLTPKRLDNLTSFADIGATISDNFMVNHNVGHSFLNRLK